METIYFQKPSELRKNLALLEKALKVKISRNGRLATIKGSGIAEYEASLVLQAMAFGFSAKKALLLKSSEFIFKIIHIRNFTRKKNLQEVRARIIGKKGKTIRTIENISEVHLLLKENELGVIGEAESITETETALKNLIKGTKQSNVYRYLEKSNKIKKEEIK